MNNYEDIINLPHPTSKKHPRMSAISRAAQFGAFRALTGHEEEIEETARLTVPMLDLSENKVSILNNRLNLILLRKSEHPIVTICYFKPDLKKSGGEYIEISGVVKKIDTYQRIIIMEDGTAIPIDFIIEIRSDIFDE